MWGDDPSYGALLSCFCAAVWIYSSKHDHTSASICKSFNEHASSYPSVSFSLCASLRFKVLIIFAVVFFLSSCRRTEVSPQGSLNFIHSRWNKGRRGLLILQDTKYYQIMTSISLMTLQEWDCFMQHLPHISFAWENSFITLKSILYWTNEEKEKKKEMDVEES